MNTYSLIIVSLFATILALSSVFCDDTVTPIPFSKLGFPLKRVGENSLEAGGSDFYQLKYNDGDETLPIDETQTLFFMVTPLAGDVDLYVRARAKPELDDKGNCPLCIAQSTSAHGDYVQIAKNSISWPTGSDWAFYILVRGAPDTVSSYSLTVWISDQGGDHTGTVINLEDGFPQVAVVLPMQYTFFKFKISDEIEIGNQGDAANDFEVVVTPFNAGDPDLFISTDGEGGTPRPTQSNNFWKSWGVSNERIQITKDDTHYTLDGWYYIGIHAFGFSRTAYFMLQVTSRKRYTHLIEAVDFQNSIAQRGAWNYYKYYMPVDKAQEILLSVSQIGVASDPDLFAYPELEFDVNSPPSVTHCTWCKQSLGDDTIVVPASDAAKGFFFIGVKAYKPDTQYSMLAVTERSNIFLREGIPSSVPANGGSYRYFKFYNYDTEIAGLTFSATAPAGSNLGMYLSDPESRNTHPTKEKKDFVGDTTGNRVSYTFMGSQKIGTYYMSVLSDLDTNVTVVASTNTTATFLQDHVPLPFVSVPRGTYRYFIFDPAVDDEGKIDGEVLVNLGVQQGEANLYVSTQVERPTKDKCEEFSTCWMAETYKADSVAIKSDDPLLGGKKRFFIGATGTAAYNLVTVMASMSGTLYELADGVSISGAVEQEGYAFYSINVENRARVNIQLTLSDSSTEANMFASKQYKPTKVGCEGEYDCYKSESIGDDVIDRTLTPGVWYISVYGVSPKEAGKTISYTIKASQKYHYLQPSDSRSPFLFESTPATSVQQIKVTPVWTTSTWLSISTTLISGRTKMYVKAGDAPATADDHDFASDGWPGNIVMIHRDASTEELFKQSQWTVGIEAMEDSDYWVYADLRDMHIHASALAENVPRLSVVSNSSRHYTISIPTNNTGTWFNPEYQPLAQEYYLNVRILQGAVRILVGQDSWHYPANVNESVLSYEGPSDTLITFGSDKIIANGEIKLTVQKLSMEDALFEFTVSQGDKLRYVVQDQPQKFLLEEKFSSFLVWNSRANPQDLVLTVESCTMDDAPQFFVSKDFTTPDKEHNDYQSGSDGSFRQRVDANMKDATKYYVGIAGKESGKSSLASIFATTHKDTSKPTIRSGRVSAAVKAENDGLREYVLTIPRADAPSRFAEKPLIYDVYMATVGKGDDKPATVNMKTVCGIQYGMAKIGSYPSTVGEGGPVSFTLEGINPNYVYQINVIVHNGMGLQSAYDGFWLVHGDYYPEFPNFIQALMIAPGTVLMTVAAFALTLYFLIGSIVNIVRGKKGVEVIPNYKFWADLPFLVMDGVILIATCCRRSTARSEYEEDVDNDVGVVNLGTNKNAGNSDDDTAGYGAI
mmetsp:Transcript_10000/g.37313  ORF Transcript_10000/g.37313 Transcript_10000/m.37313 type:complete len:1340 (-) Transcript_10000:2928-6947(-)|eukprot:CAMPEP_0117441364 /NCGR_PEP_ID=MMETSP0759-20121206/3598_1 /TAXON_ID=63605 /ORGANISM="Percolomonas cosmopolitus, Strain WS" /LENGTH=1339 /DNA_ID=CAMNT_0005233219 /DNA_START=327 /DNA_END=4346 /DNA_ORIENTATION=-